MIRFSFLLLSFTLFAQETKFQEEKEAEVLDYTNIQSVLKKDGLQSFKKKKEKKIEVLRETKKEIEVRRSSIPGESRFWSFFSKYWLAKNAALLRWDFPKPAYGIEEYFAELLETIGLINREFKILIINSPTITHFGLPSDPGEYLFVISLPFMKSLDLSKEDISLILLEDMFRIDQKTFQSNLEIDKSKIGKSYKDFSKKAVGKFNKELLEKYSELVFKKGFSFGQQFKTTKMMDQYLKPTPKLWSSYIKLLNKINKLVKSNHLYKSYNKIYPSPELQIKWLSPKKKVL